MTSELPPSLYSWAGGANALDALMAAFYPKVLNDPVLGSLFAGMPADHPHRVALFVGEVLGGPTTYSEQFGGHAHMISEHLNKGLREDQRRRFVSLLQDAADDVGLPTDPEFRAAFAGYLEWGSRLAVINSKPGAESPAPDSPMPKWNWGPVGGPYVP